MTQACTVQSAGTVAQVNCAHETPYQIQANRGAAGTAAQPATAQPAPLPASPAAANREPTVIYF